jgi:hypothetical protein
MVYAGRSPGLRRVLSHIVTAYHVVFPTGGKGKETNVSTALCSSQTQLVFEPTPGSNLMVSGGKGGGMAKVSRDWK